MTMWHYYTWGFNVFSKTVCAIDGCRKNNISWTHFGKNSEFKGLHVTIRAQYLMSPQFPSSKPDVNQVAAVGRELHFCMLPGMQGLTHEAFLMSF